MEVRVASEQKRIEAERETEHQRMEARMEEMMLYVQILNGSTIATYAICCTSTSSCDYSCEYVCSSVYVHGQDKLEHYFKPSQCNIDAIYLSSITHATSTHATLMVYVCLSHMAISSPLYKINQQHRITCLVNLEIHRDKILGLINQDLRHDGFVTTMKLLQLVGLVEILVLQFGQI